MATYLYFVFSHLNMIMFSVWLLFLLVVAFRFFKPTVYLQKISYAKLAFTAFSVRILFALFISWGQYYVWSIASDVTKTLLRSPLDMSVPFTSYLEWTRFLFRGHLGYFLYYAWGHFWLNIILLLLVSGAVYLLFSLWEKHRGGFGEQGPLLIFSLMMSIGFPEVLVLVVLGFVCALSGFIYMAMKRGSLSVQIEPFFIIAAFISLFFAHTIMLYVL